MSNFLYLRKYRIVVASSTAEIDNTQPTKGNEKSDTSNENKEYALDVSLLHCVFRVRRGMDFNNHAEVKIYNLNKDTEEKIIKEGDRLIISAGYEGYLNTINLNPEDTKKAVGSNFVSKKDSKNKTKEDNNPQQIQESQPKQYGKIFDGQIVQAVRSKENNTDYVLTLVCIDGDTFLNMNFISLSCVRGQNPRNVIDTVVSKAEKPTQVNRVSPTISGQTLPRGKVYFGRPKDILTDVARGNNANVWINDGQVNVTKITDTYTDEALILTPNNGLIGYPQQIQYGVSFRCLLNPKINVLSMVQLKNTEINGMQLQMNMPGKSQPQTLQLDEENMYQAYEVEHTGDTRGNDWYTTVNAYSRYGKDVVPAMMKGIGSNPNSI